MKKSLLAAAIVASTLSAPLFAMTESTVDLTVKLLPAASVQFEKDAIEFEADNAQMDALVEAMMHIGARGAKDGTPKKVDITFTQMGPIAANLDANKFYLTDGNENHVEMLVDFTPEGGAKIENVQKGQAIIDMETERGLAIQPSEDLTYLSQLDFTIKNHLQYDVGEYFAAIKATVAAK